MWAFNGISFHLGRCTIMEKLNEHILLHSRIITFHTIFVNVFLSLLRLLKPLHWRNLIQSKTKNSFLGYTIFLDENALLNVNKYRGQLSCFYTPIRQLAFDNALRHLPRYSCTLAVGMDDLIEPPSHSLVSKIYIHIILFGKPIMEFYSK